MIPSVSAVASGSHLPMLLVALGFLSGCIFCLPLAAKLIHEKMLRGLRWEGARVLPHRWALSGLVIERPGWRGEVKFESRGIGGGHPGHLRFRAELGRQPVGEGSPAAIPGRKQAAPLAPAGDGGPGDPEMLRRFQAPDMQERLQALDRMGGQIVGLEAEALEIRGPLLGRPEELRTFLEICESIVRGAVLAEAG